jgi:4'-phosphopantetheinyl transferase
MQIQSIFAHPSSGEVQETTDFYLPDDEVHVWWASVDLPKPVLTGLMRWLAPDEQLRAARYRYPVDCNHFVAARGLLRKLLGSYLGEPPEELRFSYGAFGKPALLHYAGEPFLTFNVSHAGSLAFFAISRARAVGIDVERIPTENACTEAAAQLFTPEEYRVWHTLPQDRRSEAFGACWTRKEAYLKARGVGFSVPPGNCEVSFLPDEPARLVWVWDDVELSCPWSLLPLNVSPGYAAALAAAGKSWNMVCRQIPVEREIPGRSDHG